MIVFRVSCVLLKNRDCGVRAAPENNVLNNAIKRVRTAPETSKANKPVLLWQGCVASRPLPGDIAANSAIGKGLRRVVMSLQGGNVITVPQVWRRSRLREMAKGVEKQWGLVKLLWRRY
jgi:hypothetical protein